MAGQEPGELKISEVALGTGISKELIHHYLRQGLLPRPSSRARYSAVQVRLLHLIRRLRDEHHLPLDSIRRLFETFDFDPGHLEPLVLADSFSHRLARFADGELGISSETYSEEELCAAAGISQQRLQDYLGLQLLTPVDAGERTRYSDYDAKIIALCERGVELGIAFEAFRTVASHIRVAWQLEHAQFFELEAGVRGEAGEGSSTDRTLGQLFLRREIVGQFVQSVLDGLILRHLQQQLVGPERGRGEAVSALERVIYRPSASFLRLHGLDEQIDRLQLRLARAVDRPDLWERLAQLQLHAGRHREAAFVLEQALERWPQAPGLTVLYGAALLLAGSAERGQQILAGISGAPLAWTLLALARLGEQGRSVGAAVKGLDEVRRLGEAALEAVNEDRPEAALVQLLCGWILTALPPALRQVERGRRILRRTRARIEDAAAAVPRALPGLRQRYLINSGFLLLESSTRQPGDDPAELEALRAEICRLDPGCAFAEQVYLQAPAGGRTEEEG